MLDTNENRLIENRLANTLTAKFPKRSRYTWKTFERQNDFFFLFSQAEMPNPQSAVECKVGPEYKT